MLIDERTTLNSILQITSDVLDIPDHVYEDAVLKYEDVGEHLAADDSDLRQYNPQVYVQGSFRLGTVVQPYGRGDEYDIDLVCQLDIAKDEITQQDLKNEVGQRLKTRKDLAKILSPSRRCWLLDYPAEPGMPGFHMDVLPSIPNIERPPTGILLTDTELVRWQKSNPITYAEWFKSKMEVVFKTRKEALAKSMNESIEDVPDWRVKTPLQRAIQILKRHRDICFQDNPDVKPVSITLTTLAALAYQNQEDIFDALIGITRRMPLFIENRNGKWWVQNPVDPDENFADKWNQYPERREAFMKWLDKVEQDFSSLSKSESLVDGLELLEKSVGRPTMTRVAEGLGVQRNALLPAVISKTPIVPALANTSHTQAPLWPIVQRYRVSIKADVYHSKKGRKLWLLSDRSVPKDVWLKFIAKTDVPRPYTIKWQVVNTGQEAMNAGQLRGDYYDSDYVGNDIRWESTSYKGTHYVEAFVIKDGVCVARSKKCFVRVR